MKLLLYLKNKTFIIFRYFIENRNTQLLKNNKGLWTELNNYLLKSKSTGCNISDYWEIYNYVRKNKPKEILECGTGVSTVVMAYALIENEREGFKGRITSMESINEYLLMAKKLLPENMTKYVDFVLSLVIQDNYLFYRGMRYEKIPDDRNYDFVYVDGPSYFCPIDGSVTFDFDLIHVLKNSNINISAIVDKRVTSCYVYQKILGIKKVKYNAITHLGFIGPCNKFDLLNFNKNEPSSVFVKSYSNFFNTKLNFNLTDKYFKNKV
tara:strand:- start:274 stop:1071 length:798 start_codon:yes stop_codon:yes gene_type:complete